MNELQLTIFSLFLFINMVKLFYLFIQYPQSFFHITFFLIFAEQKVNGCIKVYSNHFRIRLPECSLTDHLGEQLCLILNTQPYGVSASPCSLTSLNRKQIIFFKIFNKCFFHFFCSPYYVILLKSIIISG